MLGTSSAGRLPATTRRPASSPTRYDAGAVEEPAISTSLGQLGTRPAWKRVIARFVWTRVGATLLDIAHWVLPSHQPIGVLAVVLDADGRVLLLDHLTRSLYPLGLPGGWLARAELPEDGLRRELREELGIEVSSTAYLCSAQHQNRNGIPTGLTLVYLASVVPGSRPRVSAEILGGTWLPLDEATAMLRDFEADALRLAAQHAAGAPDT